ncbi:MAG: hypothetical protein JXQ73_02495 [Phycisphaerae bacterium]|nr:hypothetical protein [Phycisphaerae bacterium]
MTADVPTVGKLIEDASDAIALAAGARGLYKTAGPGRAVLMASGGEGAPHPIGRTASLRAQDWARRGLAGIGRHVLTALGIETELDDDDVVGLLTGRYRAADLLDHTPVAMAGTGDLTHILKASAEKIVQGLSVEQDKLYERIARGKTVTTFHEVDLTTLSEAPRLHDLAEGGEIRYVDFKDSGETARVQRYAVGTRLSFEAVMNLGAAALADAMASLVASAYAKRVELLIGFLASNPVMSDGKALFHEDRGNLLEGTGEAGPPTSVAAHNEVEHALEQQRGMLADETGETRPLGLKYAGVLVPSVLKGVTKQFLGSGSDPAQTNPRVANTWGAGRLWVESDPLLDTTSETAWYGLANPRLGHALAYLLMRGYELPRVYTEAAFGTGDVRSAVVDIFGTGLQGYRGIVKNVGA